MECYNLMRTIYSFGMNDIQFQCVAVNYKINKKLSKSNKLEKKNPHSTF